MTIAQLLSAKGGELHTVRPDDTVAVTVSLFNREKRPLVIVTEPDDRIVGVVSVSDLVRALERHGDWTLHVKVKEIMTSVVETCTAHEDFEPVLERMNLHHIRHMPVVEGGRVLGIISVGDVLKALLDASRVNMEQLQNYFLKMGGRY